MKPFASKISFSLTAWWGLVDSTMILGQGTKKLGLQEKSSLERVAQLMYVHSHKYSFSSSTEPRDFFRGAITRSNAFRNVCTSGERHV